MFSEPCRVGCLSLSLSAYHFELSTGLTLAFLYQRALAAVPAQGGQHGCSRIQLVSCYLIR